MKIALVGNPNSGKTTLFNVLTGSTAQVGNWPGVTVEKKVGLIKGHKDIQVIDLPGIYSLSPFTLEERITRDYLVHEKPDLIVNIVDSTNLDRNLYLTTQLIETDIKTIIALNMMDVIKKRNVKIDKEKLSEILKCQVVDISAAKEQGIDNLIKKIINTNENYKKDTVNIYSNTINDVLTTISKTVQFVDNDLYYSVKVFEKDSVILGSIELDDSDKNLILSKIEEIESTNNDDSSSIISSERYRFIDDLIDKVIDKKDSHLRLQKRLTK